MATSSELRSASSVGSRTRRARTVTQLAPESRTALPTSSSRTPPNPPGGSRAPRPRPGSTSRRMPACLACTRHPGSWVAKRSSRATGSASVALSSRVAANIASSRRPRAAASSTATRCASLASSSRRCGSRFSTASRRLARGLRIWWEASETKARCRSNAVPTTPTIVLNDAANRRSSGGPVTSSARVSRRPRATAAVASSSWRTGRSTQREMGQAARTSPPRGTSPTSPSSSHCQPISARNPPVGEAIATTATTSLSRPTGSTTCRGRACHGQRRAGGSGRYPANACRSCPDRSSPSISSAAGHASLDESSTSPPGARTATGMPYRSS